MVFVPVTPAVAGGLASSVENNKIISNCIDLDSRVTSNTSIITNGTTGNAALGTRVTALETGGVVGLKRAVYPSQSTNLTAAVAVETDIPKLQVLNLPVTNGVLYRFNYVLNVTGSVAGDAFEIRLRRGSAVTGPLLAVGQHINPSSGGTPRINIPLYWIASPGGTLSFYVSVIRVLGTGTATIFQNADYKNFVEVFHVGVPGGGVIETPA